MINFSFIDIKFNFSNRRVIKTWLKVCAANENRKAGELNFIFCSDTYLLSVNQEYLKHDCYTDIITFDYCEKNILNGDIFISIDRVKENANLYEVTFENELMRLLIHGILHLCGYEDKIEELKAIMTEKEDFYLKALQKI